MAEQRSFRAEAVVLRHANWGEADRILTLYTREQGKLRAIVKGALFRLLHFRELQSLGRQELATWLDRKILR